MTPATPTSNDVWLLLEKEARRLGHFSLGLIREGRRLSERRGGALCAIGVGMAIENLGELAGRHGIEHLYRLADEASCGPDRLADSIATLVSAHRPALLLAVASSFGADLMPRLSARLRAPLLTNCLDIAAPDDFEFTRAIHGGRQRATLRCPAGGLQLATLSPEAFGPTEAPNSPRRAEVIEVSLAPPGGLADRVRYRQHLKADHRTVDIREAEYIVVVGKGVGTPEKRAVIERFADLIGAALGGSRPAVDAGVVPYDRQVGQTGKKVSPRLIVLCGVSGSEYFMRGIEPSAVKVAINPDRKAPVFAAADLGIVADANELIPRFLDYVHPAA